MLVEMSYSLHMPPAQVSKGNPVLSRTAFLQGQDFVILVTHTEVWEGQGLWAFVT